MRRLFQHEVPGRSEPCTSRPQRTHPGAANGRDLRQSRSKKGNHENLTLLAVSEQRKINDEEEIMQIKS